MTDYPTGRLLTAFLLVAVFIICAGQVKNGVISPAYVKQIQGMRAGRQSIFSCEFINITGDYELSWAVNGVAISNSTYVFNAEYKDVYKVLGEKTYSSTIGSDVPLEHHLFNFSCRLYANDEFVPNGQVEPLYETSMATLKVINEPSDPICELGLTQDHMGQPLIEFNCCVYLTREALSVSLTQGTVIWHQNETEFVDDLSTGRRQCFKYDVQESSLSTAGNFNCCLEGNVFKRKKTCAFQSFKPEITLSRIEDNHADLTCTYEANNIVGYTWTVDKDIEYKLSDDSKHFYTRNEDRKTITVSCTVFTKSGYGSAKLQIIAKMPDPKGLANQSIVIIVGCILAGIIIFLFLIIIAYLIVIRGICFCFRPPDRYTERDLRRMQLERESIAHFRMLHGSHSTEGGVQLVIQNGGHRYHAAASADDDVPPVPGGNVQFSSHLLDYADLDHGNARTDDSEEMPAPPHRSDTTKVEYADILKPPTTSLRDMS